LWARGYFCTTVGPVTEEMIKGYIESQHDEDNIKVEADFQS
jgi:putative transposase